MIITVLGCLVAAAGTFVTVSLMSATIPLLWRFDGRALTRLLWAWRGASGIVVVILAMLAWLIGTASPGVTVNMLTQMLDAVTLAACIAASHHIRERIEAVHETRSAP